MKYTLHAVPTQTFEAFVNEHGLEIEVKERGSETLKCSWIGPDSRYHASFASHCEIIRDGMLSSAYGNGPTPEAAIEDFAKELSEKRIVFDAYRDTRREIKCPRFVPDSPKEPAK